PTCSAPASCASSAAATPILPFSFHAEDGIRDFHVTGVQTCALPISIRDTRGVSSSCANESRCGQQRASPLAKHWCAKLQKVTERSEERRVGKECRAPGAQGRERERAAEGGGAPASGRRP